MSFFFAPGCDWRAQRLPDREEVLRRGAELLNEGKADAAVELIRPLASGPQLDVPVSLLYGRALVQNEQASLAIWPLERATAAPDAPLGSRALFVQALLMGGAARDSIREATRLLDEDPENAVVRRLRADAYTANLQHEEALADLAFLADQSPGDARVLEAQLELLTEMDRFDEAREVIAKLRVLMERENVASEAAAHFCAAAARFEHDRGESERALEQLDACLERHPNDPTVLLSRVDVLDGSGREEEATAFLERAASENSARMRLQYALATRLARIERPNDAEAVLVSAAKTVGGAQPLLALADIRVSRRNFPGAAEAVLDAIRNELGRGPGDPDFEWTELPAEALFAFGDLFISAEDYGHAEEIIAVIDQEAYELLLKGRLALVKGDPAGALEIYERGFKLWPANSGARYLAGVAAMRLGEFDRAASFYQDAVRSDSKANDAGLVLARMLIAQGYPGAALDLLGVYNRENPDQPHAIRLFGTAAMMAGLADYAEGARAKLAGDPDWAGIALADHARDVLRVSGADAARNYLEASAELDSPTNFEALWSWAEILAQLGRFDVAVEKVASLRRTAPDAAGHAISWARILAKQEKWQEARKVLEPLADAHPGLVAAQRDLGKVLLALGEVDAALDRFDRADRLDPLDPEASELACLGLLERGSTEPARARCDAFLARHPWHGLAALRLASACIDAGDRGDQTLILARQAARFIGSSGPEAYAVLGRLLVARGESKEAVDPLARAIQKGVASASDRHALAKALIGQGRVDAARKELQGLLDDPELPANEAEAVRATLSGLATQQSG